MKQFLELYCQNTMSTCTMACLSVCVCVREAERESCVGKREKRGRKRKREVRKWNKKETGRYRETGGEWEKTYVLYIHWPASIFFSTGDSCGHTLSTSALGAPPKHTHSHTHTHYTHTVHTPKSKHQNDLYTVFTAHLCSLSVMSL